MSPLRDRERGKQTNRKREGRRKMDADRKTGWGSTPEELDVKLKRNCCPERL